LHSSLGWSPFEALCGRQPKLLGLTPPAAAKGNVNSWLTERVAMS
jgi:hypothetical protein